MTYRLNRDALKKSFNFGARGIDHKVKSSEWEVLPFSTKKAMVPDFWKVMGEFSRLRTHQEQAASVEIEALMEKITEKVDFSGAANKSELNELVKTLFFVEDELYLFHPQVLLYIQGNAESDKVARFLFDTLLEKKGKLELQPMDAPMDVMTRLLFESLPPLKERKSKKKHFASLVPNVRELFQNDYEWLLENQQYYIKYFDKLLRFYYFFYVSQFLFACTELQNDQPTTHFILEWERFSGSRVSYEKGWKRLERYFDQMFAHAVTLKVLNLTEENRQEFYGYNEFFHMTRQLRDEDRISLMSDLEYVIEEYKLKMAHEVNFTALETLNSPYSDELQTKVFELFKVIHHQFLFSRRNKENDKYKKWFEVFCKADFLKQGGQWGLVLKLNAEYLLFLTRLILKNNSKMRLNELFHEFKLRGVAFDRITKKAIIEYFEELNILEKKSDSGDAYYVKTFL